MRLFLLTVLTMCALAGNSILNRWGVDVFGLDPMTFAVLRTVSGAAVLWVLVRGRGGRIGPLGRARWAGAAALSVYMIGFSWAYLTLGAGIGALILFGSVQLVMFAVAVGRGQAVSLMRWSGAGVAFAGLVLLLWPGGSVTIPLAGAASMAAAGAAWGCYTLLGQRAADALAATAGNFALAVPMVLPTLLLSAGGPVSFGGGVTAVLSGAVTSGLGYALWYRVLPRLDTTVAAVAQLSVPVIAVAAGLVLLAEPVTGRTVLAGALVLGGIGLSLLRGRRV